MNARETVSLVFIKQLKTFLSIVWKKVYIAFSLDSRSVVPRCLFKINSKLQYIQYIKIYQLTIILNKNYVSNLF